MNTATTHNVVHIDTRRRPRRLTEADLDRANERKTREVRAMYEAAFAERERQRIQAAAPVAKPSLIQVGRPALHARLTRWARTFFLQLRSPL